MPKSTDNFTPCVLRRIFINSNHLNGGSPASIRNESTTNLRLCSNLSRASYCCNQKYRTGSRAAERRVVVVGFYILSSPEPACCLCKKVSFISSPTGACTLFSLPLFSSHLSYRNVSLCKLFVSSSTMSFLDIIFLR